MKKSEIKKGVQYSDGKGGVRLVVDVGPQYVLFTHQQDLDCIRFRVISKIRGPLLVGSEHNCTRTSFASWAKHETAFQ